SQRGRLPRPGARRREQRREEEAQAPRWPPAGATLLRAEPASRHEETSRADTRTDPRKASARLRAPATLHFRNAQNAKPRIGQRFGIGSAARWRRDPRT